MVLYYTHVRFYIVRKGRDILVEVIPNVHSFSCLVLDICTVIIDEIIIPDLFFHSLGHGIQ